MMPRMATGMWTFFEPGASSKLVGGKTEKRRVVDRAAVELLGDSAGGSGGGVLVVDAESEDGVDETGEGEDRDEEAHGWFDCTAVGVKSRQ